MFPLAVVTLTTDFGLSDSYVSQMKGVILSICREAAIVDIAHSVLRFDVPAGARVLAEAVPYFPPGSIHVGVIDPSVGTARKRLIIEALVSCANQPSLRKAFFIGPDNGLFSYCAPMQKRVGVWEISNLDLLPHPLRCRTFEGRDVFAPVAAMLARGARPSDFGPQVNSGDLVELASAVVPAIGARGIHGIVTHVDSFGNAVTNISESDISGQPQEVIVIGASGEESHLAVVTVYADIPSGKAAALINSQGRFEIAANARAVSEVIPVSTGSRVVVQC